MSHGFACERVNRFKIRLHDYHCEDGLSQLNYTLSSKRSKDTDKRSNDSTYVSLVKEDNGKTTTWSIKKDTIESFPKIFKFATQDGN